MDAPSLPLEACRSAPIPSISARLSLRSGEGRRLDLHAAPGPLSYGGSALRGGARARPVRLDVSRTTDNGYALRLRFDATLRGPCMRCLEPADADLPRRRPRGPQPGAAATSCSRPTSTRRRARPRGLGARRPVARRAGPDHLQAGLPRPVPDCGENLNEDPATSTSASPTRAGRSCASSSSTEAAVRYPSRRHGRPQAEAVALAHHQAPVDAQGRRADAQRVPAVPQAAPPAPGVPELRLLRGPRGRPCHDHDHDHDH